MQDQLTLLETDEDKLEKVQQEIAKADETLARYYLDIAAARRTRRELREEIAKLKREYDSALT